MAIFDPKQMCVVINGREIQDFADGGDVISLTANQPAGGYTMGNGGTGVFVANPDRSGKLVLKLKQHSPDNAYLNRLFALQKNNIKDFVPISCYIRDLLNEDAASGVKGFFTDRPTMTRGNAHNPSTWTIEFEQVEISLEKGVG